MLDQTAATPGVVAARDVIENQRAVLQMLACQFVFDALLPRAQPVESLVKFLVFDGPQVQLRRQVKSR